MGYALLALHSWFQRAAEPIRYARAKWALRKVMRPINKQIETARRQHKPVKHLLSARRSLLNYGLRVQG